MALANAVYGHANDEMELERPGGDVVMPRFYMEKQMNKRKSDDARRAIYDEYEAAEFIIPGDNTTVHKERVTDEHRHRWPKQYAAFKAGIEQINGMPLESWYAISNHPGLIEEMRALKIRSVEDLAGINDDYATRAPWGRDWRKKAQDELARQKSQDSVLAANAELSAKLEEMSAQLAALQAAQAQSSQAEPAKRGPGRPPNKD